MQEQDRRQSRFGRRLALYEANGNRVVGPAAFEDARRAFAAATLARKLAPSSTTAAAQTRAFLRLREVAAEVAR